LIVTVIGIQFLLYSAVTVVAFGAMIRAVGMIYIGQRPTLGSCLRYSWNRFLTVLLADLMLNGAVVVIMIPLAIAIYVSLTSQKVAILLCTLIALIAFIVAATYFQIGLVLTIPSIIIESSNITTPIQGLKRSWELADGSRCYLLCTLLLFALVSNLITRLLHNMFLTKDLMDALFSVAGIVVTVIPLLVFFTTSCHSGNRLVF